MKAMPATPSAIPGCLERRGNRLASFPADRPFERPVQVGERLVKTFGMARGKTQIGLDRAGEVAVLGSLAVEPKGLAARVMLEDGVVGDRPFQRSGGADDAEAVVVLAPIVICEAVIVAMPPLLSSARTVKSSSSARPGTNVFSRARSRTADSPVTNRTNS